MTETFIERKWGRDPGVTAVGDKDEGQPPERRNLKSGAVEASFGGRVGTN
jgi:hypothetical protein